NAQPRLFYQKNNKKTAPPAKKKSNPKTTPKTQKKTPAAPDNMIESRREEATTRITPHTKIRAAGLSPISAPANLLVISSDSQPRALSRATEISFVSARPSQKTPREVRAVSIARIALPRL